jgi:hypothetical protein
MTLHLNDAGTWRTIQGVYVNDAGTWRTIQAVYVNDAGTWRQVYSNDVILLPSTSVSASATAPTDATANLRIDADGHQYQGSNTFVDVGAYITPTGNAGNYSVRGTELSGTVSTGTVGSWLALTSDRTWQVTFTGNSGSKSCTLLLEFALTADTSNVVYSQSVTMSADVSP